MESSWAQMGLPYQLPLGTIDKLRHMTECLVTLKLLSHMRIILLFTVSQTDNGKACLS